MDRMFTRELIGKSVYKDKDKIGTIRDFVIDTCDFSIKYILVDSTGCVVNQSTPKDSNGNLIVNITEMIIDGDNVRIN